MSSHSASVSAERTAFSGSGSGSEKWWILVSEQAVGIDLVTLTSTKRNKQHLNVMELVENLNLQQIIMSGAGIVRARAHKNIITRGWV